MRRGYVFAMLVMLHLGGFLYAPKPLAPFLAGSVYLPLTALKFMGLPVYASSEAWGWASPSIFGWLAVGLLWTLLWWGIASVFTRSQRRG